MSAITRRRFLGNLAVAATVPCVLAGAATPTKGSFRLRYVLSSAMYGEMPLETILPQVAKTGADAIDIWCRPHGNQREQIEAMGDAAFTSLLARHRVKLGVSTRYPLGPFGQQDEMRWMKKFGGGIVVTGSKGPKEPAGAEARTAVRDFLESMKPHVAAAEECGVTIAIENHDKQLLYHPDSLRYFAELNRSAHLGIALAFHHLHLWQSEIPGIIRELGAKQLPFIYFQEHSEGIRKKVSKDIEMKQMPGYGELDYRPIVHALRGIDFKGFVEIFMHPTPRGIPILPTTAEVTAAINKSRSYVEECLKTTEATKP